PICHLSLDGIRRSLHRLVISVVNPATWRRARRIPFERKKENAAHRSGGKSGRAPARSQQLLGPAAESLVSRSLGTVGDLPAQFLAESARLAARGDGGLAARATADVLVLSGGGRGWPPLQRRF